MTYPSDFTVPAELGAEPYQRSVERQGHANGYKPKTV
jgi:hypothetical protein